ncbi:MAG: F0F1 ATP synthase subunit delta [Chthoniobacterales bacterium]
MKISKEARRTSREVFNACLNDGRLDPGKVRAYSDGLIEAKPRGYTQILKEFARLIRLELGKRHAVVESAAPLEGPAAEQIDNDLRTRFGNDLTFEHRVTPSLLGGLRVQVGSDVWDGTVLNRLQQLKQKL